MMNPEFRIIDANGIGIRVALKGRGPLVVMVHGFPESWSSWRHQMEPLAAAGFTACAIDVRGYGGSAKPREIEAYDIEALAGDVAGVIDALSPNAPAVLIGHDWGAPIVWNTALFHPSKVRAVAGMSVPYTGVAPRPLTELIDEVFTQRGVFFYMAYFQDEGVAEAELEADTRGSLRKIFHAWSGEGVWPTNKKVGEKIFDGVADPETLPAWLTEADLDYLSAEFARSGWRGPLNRYRNSVRDWQETQRFVDQQITQPSLYIVGDRDPVMAMFPNLEARMRPNMADLRGIYILPGVGHWTQQEAPDLVTGILIDWLAGLD